MDERTLESRLLELAFTTEAPITATALAFFAPCSVQEAGALLDRLATTGTLRIESDDEGNVYYELPNRARLAGPTSQALAKSPPPSTALGRPGVAQRPVQPSGPPLVNPVMSVGSPGVSPFAQTALAPIPKPESVAPVPVTAGDLAAAREAARDPSAMVECPYCAELIRAAARKCKHCGEMIDPALRQAPQPVQVNVQNVQTVAPPQHNPHAMVVHDPRHSSPGVAALLSFLWPGAGQIYTGRVGAGLLWLLGTIVAYIPFLIPGLVVHIICIFNAAKVARLDNANRTRALLGAGDAGPSLIP